MDHSEEEYLPNIIEDPTAQRLQALIDAAPSSQEFLVELQDLLFASAELHANIVQIGRYSQFLANPEGITPDLQKAFRVGAFLGLRTLQFEMTDGELSPKLYKALNRYYIDAWRLMNDENITGQHARDLRSAHLMNDRIGEIDGFGDIHNDIIDVVDGVVLDLFDNESEAGYVAVLAYNFVYTAIDWYDLQPELEPTLDLQRAVYEAREKYAEAERLEARLASAAILNDEFYRIVSTINPESTDGPNIIE
jgi:hypothetical protein